MVGEGEKKIFVRLAVVDVTVVDDEDERVLWQCERIQMLSADTLSVLIVPQKAFQSDSPLSSYFPFSHNQSFFIKCQADE